MSGLMGFALRPDVCVGIWVSHLGCAKVQAGNGFGRIGNVKRHLLTDRDFFFEQDGQVFTS